MRARAQSAPVAEPTDDDTIAARYVAQIDQRPRNALYERPNTPALLPDVKDKDVMPPARLPARARAQALTFESRSDHAAWGKRRASFVSLPPNFRVDPEPRRTGRGFCLSPPRTRPKTHCVQRSRTVELRCDGPVIAASGRMNRARSRVPAQRVAFT
jgi:hypothetical protein